MEIVITSYNCKSVQCLPEWVVNRWDNHGRAHAWLRRGRAWTRRCRGVLAQPAPVAVVRHPAPRLLLALVHEMMTTAASQQVCVLFHALARARIARLQQRKQKFKICSIFSNLLVFKNKSNGAQMQLTTGMLCKVTAKYTSRCSCRGVRVCAGTERAMCTCSWRREGRVHRPSQPRPSSKDPTRLASS